MKPEPNQVDPSLWVYEIGENSDCSVDAAICDNVKDLIALFRDTPNAKATLPRSVLIGSYSTMTHKARLAFGLV